MTPQALSSPRAHAPDPLPESASLLLDVLRFSLCLMVVIGHTTMPYFNANWPNLMWMADLAVPGFFVLSGFVIRYVTVTRERDAARYFASRASRIYSVVLPAAALTLVLDAIDLRINPEFYHSVFAPQPWHGLPTRLLLNLVFLTQGWGRTVLLMSDTPLWSLGYEVPYYVLFGVALFLRGWRRIALLVLCAALAGPQVLLLLPVWCSGLWLYDLWQWLRRPATRPAARVTALALCSAATAWLATSWRGSSGFARIASLQNPLLLMHQPVVRATMDKYATALLSFAVLIILLCCTDWLRMSKNTSSARAIRFVAESTFTLYVFHFPLLMFAGSLGIVRPASSWNRIGLILAIVSFSVAASVPIERLKPWMRRSIFTRVREKPALA